jgi:hypothetical protein
MVIAMTYSDDYKRRVMEDARETLRRTAKYARPKLDDAPPPIQIDDPVETWRKDAEAFDELRERETRRRVCAAAEQTRAQHQRSADIEQLRSAQEQTAAGLVDVAKATGVMGESIAASFADMGSEIKALRERLIAAETRCTEADKRERATANATAVRERDLLAQAAALRSEVADLRLELRSAIVTHLAGGLSPPSVKDVN